MSLPAGPHRIGREFRQSWKAPWGPAGLLTNASSQLLRLITNSPIS